MRWSAPCLFALAAALPAQATVNVGLQMVASGIVGQQCGPLACAPFPGGTVALLQQRTFVHWSVPYTPYLIAIGLPGPCMQVPGIANSLLLAPASVVLLSVGATGGPPLNAWCLQGQGRYTLTFPASAPLPITFRIQSVGMTTNAMVGLGPAIELTLQ
jgi:hypothetical protein